MTQLLVTCEHASREIPQEYAALFANYDALLATHRGYDIGAVDVYEYFCQQFACPHFKGDWSRMLCDLNRSSKHPSCFSEITRDLPKDTRDHLIQDYHQPYHHRVHQQIKNMLLRDDSVIHISVHSFTPELKGEIRNADIGFLYDPKRSLEKSLCLRWKEAIKQAAPDLRVRMNYPYLGTSDGLTQILRHHFQPQQYAGIELEMNQALTSDPKNNLRLQKLMAETLKSSLYAGI